MSERRLKLRLNVSSYRRITDKNGLKDEEVCKRTGLSEKTLSWILDNQYTEGSILERIADAIGCTPDEIALPDTMRNTENVIEWLRDQEQATLTLTQPRTITSVKSWRTNTRRNAGLCRRIRMVAYAHMFRRSGLEFYLWRREQKSSGNKLAGG